MKNSKQVVKFAKQILLFSSPLLLLTALYFYFDPFYILKHYQSYPDNYLHSYNRNRISTQVFLNNNEKENYDSFIFGSSKSSVFYTKDWQKHIGSDKTYHFDASNETISGIYGKVKFVEEQGNEIKNALLLFDSETFKYTADTANSVIHIQDWRWTEQSRIAYHLVFFKAFFKDLYFIKYFDVLLNKRYKPYMHGVFENKHMLYTAVKNDFIFQEYIDRIKQDSLSYYQADLWYDRGTEKDSMDALIEPYQIKYLIALKEIFERKNTAYKVIFGPNFDQKYVSTKDKALVISIFGKENVHDFTGKNQYTEPLSNYYEIYHYKPVVARAIMDSVYAK